MTQSATSPVPGGAGALGARRVARIGYGAMQLARLHADPRAAVRLVRHALEGGVDHLDTARFYGDGFVNDVLRRAVPDDGRTVIATKVGAETVTGGPVPLRPAQRPEELRAGVEENLRSLGRDRLDLVYLRRMDAGSRLRASGDQEVPLADQLAVMTALRQEGKIAAIGLSSIGLETLRTALPAGIVAVQNPYSVLSREGEEMLRLCRAEAIAWVPFFPLGGAASGSPRVADDPGVRRAASDLGATPAQIGLAWQLRHSPGTLLVPGTASIPHLDENLAAGAVVLDEATMELLDGLG